jgi:hypothetical protein
LSDKTLPSLGDVQSVPAEAAGGRKTGESSFDRKLLSVLNSMAADGTYFREVQPT